MMDALSNSVGNREDTGGRQPSSEDAGSSEGSYASGRGGRTKIIKQKGNIYLWYLLETAVKSIMLLIITRIS